jgi:hypothetical protein
VTVDLVRRRLSGTRPFRQAMASIMSNSDFIFVCGAPVRDLSSKSPNRWFGVGG